MIRPDSVPARRELPERLRGELTRRVEQQRAEYFRLKDARDHVTGADYRKARAGT